MSELEEIYEKISKVRSRLEHDALPYQLMGLVREVHEGIASLLGVDAAVTQIEAPVVEEATIVEETPAVEETVDAPIEKKVVDAPAKAKNRNAATAE